MNLPAKSWFAYADLESATVVRIGGRQGCLFGATVFNCADGVCFAWLHSELEAFGLVLPPGGPRVLPEAVQLAADETPIQYCPQVRGTYQEEGHKKQITIIAAREKRSITGTPGRLFFLF